MYRLVWFMLVFTAVGPVEAFPQITHAADTSSVFPVGFYTFYGSRRWPPFDGMEGTLWGTDACTIQEIQDWLKRDEAHLADVNANYFVEGIPHLYKALNPATNSIELLPFEGGVFRNFALNNGIRIDYRNIHDWMGPNPDAVQEVFRTCPDHLPPSPPDEVWTRWYAAMDTALDSVVSVVRDAPYATFYVAHESEVYPDYLQGRPVQENGIARRHALQYVCRRWDELAPADCKVKPFVVISSLTELPTVDPVTHRIIVQPAAHACMKDIAERCKNLRMIAMDHYGFHPYVLTTYASPDPERYPHLIHFNTEDAISVGQNEVFDALANKLDHFREAFMNVSFRDEYPIELWFVGQAHKCYAVDNDTDRNAMVRAGYYSMRYPTYEELKLQASMALSRGYKGILWYSYGSGQLYPPPYSAENPPTFQDTPFGVVDEQRNRIETDLDIGMYPPHPWSACAHRTVNPFDNVRRVNDTIRLLGAHCRKLDFVEIFDQTTISPGNNVNLVYADVSDDALPMFNTFNDEALDLSIFRSSLADEAQSNDYVMVVNTVLNSTYDSCEVDPKKEIVLAFGTKVLLYDPVRDQEYESRWEFAHDGRPGAYACRDSIWPGEAKLYRISPAVPSDGDPTTLLGIGIGIYPNPFVSRTVIEYTLPAAAPVTITVYSILGERVAIIEEGMRTKGTHGLEFHPSPALAEGNYILELRCPLGVKQTVMTLVH